MLQSLEKGETNSVHLEMRRKVGGREGFTQEGASKHQLFFPEKDPHMVSSPVPAPQGVTLLTIVVQEGTALHRWKNSLAYRTFFTLNFNLPCHSIRVGRKRSGAGGGGVFVSRGTEVPGGITTFVPTLPLLVYNGNATKKRAMFSASLTSDLGK